MTVRLRILVAALLALAGGANAFAQQTPPPAENELVGPPQLRDFSLNGTVTRPAAEQPQPAPRAAPAVPPAAQRQAAPSPVSDSAPRAASPRVQAEQDSSPSSATVELPPPTPAQDFTVPPGELMADPLPAGQQPSATPGDVAEAQGQLPFLPWLIAALALAAGLAWYVFHRRQRERLAAAGAGPVDLFERGPAVPPGTQAPPRPQPAAAPPAAAPPPVAGGIVSTSLRPWLEVEFTPVRVILDENSAAVEFEMALFNSGSAPARAVRFEAAMFNANPQQDRQIGAFFGKPIAASDPVPVVPPLQRVSVRSLARIPLAQLHQIVADGRPLLVPMLALNVRYAWSSGAGQSARSYLIGKTTGGDKLAPFRLDLGPRMFRGLAAREHELHLRK